MWWVLRIVAACFRQRVSVSSVVLWLCVNWLCVTANASVRDLQHPEYTASLTHLLRELSVLLLFLQHPKLSVFYSLKYVVSLCSSDRKCSALHFHFPLSPTDIYSQGSNAHTTLAQGSSSHQALHHAEHCTLDLEHRNVSIVEPHCVHFLWNILL